MGQTTIEEAILPVLNSTFSLIADEKIFKVISITHTPQTLTSRIKLREIGTEIFDGNFLNAGAFVGSAIIRESFVSEGEAEDNFINSVVGAGIIDRTVIEEN